MNEPGASSPRRRFLRLMLLSSAAVPTCAALMSAPALAADMPHIDEADPTAGALGYKHDTTAVDKAKYAAHTAEQSCANCNLALAAQGDGWMPCQIFPGKAVNPKGWCAAWVKKA
jgi:hypothetical protein